MLNSMRELRRWMRVAFKTIACNYGYSFYGGESISRLREMRDRGQSRVTSNSGQRYNSRLRICTFKRSHDFADDE
jgi:hypothetical protein